MDGEEGGQGDFKKRKRKEIDFFFKKREKISFITPKPRRGCIFQQTELHQEFFVFFFCCVNRTITAAIDSTLH